MFQKGDRVVCVDEDMGATGSVLVKDKAYTVKEYYSPEGCAKFWPNEVWWQENGGRVVLEPNSLEWYGRRFKKNYDIPY